VGNSCPTRTRSSSSTSWPGLTQADLHRVLRGEKDTNEVHIPTSFHFTSSTRVAQPDLLEAGRVQRVNKQRRGDFNFVGGDVLSGGE
jgi:hypothetical protein